MPKSRHTKTRLDIDPNVQKYHSVRKDYLDAVAEYGENSPAVSRIKSRLTKLANAVPKKNRK